jgi:hypothetical protein
MKYVGYLTQAEGVLKNIGLACKDSVSQAPNDEDNNKDNDYFEVCFGKHVSILKIEGSTWPNLSASPKAKK